MNPHRSRPTSLFSETDTSHELLIHHVFSSGIKIKLRIIPNQVLATKSKGTTPSSSQRKARISNPSTSCFRQTDTASSPKNTFEERTHQDSVTARVFPTAPTARTSLSSAQRAEQRKGPITAHKREAIKAFESPSIQIAERDEELLGWKNRLPLPGAVRVVDEENVDTKDSEWTAGSFVDLNEYNEEWETLWSLIEALIPKN